MDHRQTDQEARHAAVIRAADQEARRAAAFRMLARAHSDPAYLAKMHADPHAVLAEAGLSPLVIFRPSTAYFRYGVPALQDRLLALPTRRQPQPPFELSPATPERIQIECGIVDEWAIELLDYCRRRPHGELRFYAMLLEARRMDPVDMYWRMGLYPTSEACARVRDWLQFARTCRIRM